MDPQATLKEIRELCTEWHDPEYAGDPVSDMARLVELTEALDEWLVKGGFPPPQWLDPADVVI